MNDIIFIIPSYIHVQLILKRSLAMSHLILRKASQNQSLSDVEREGLQEPPLNFESESEMESDSDIDKSERQAESDSNEFQGNSETSFEWPKQITSYFEPLYPDANITKCGAYYSIMLYALKFTLSNKAIHGLTILLHLFCPSPNSLPKSEYRLKHFSSNSVFLTNTKLFVLPVVFHVKNSAVLV